MAELKAVELVDLVDSETETQEKEIILKEDFNWFLTDEFDELGEGFKPTDNSEFIKEFCKNYNINSLKEKIPQCNTTEQEQEQEEPFIKYNYRCYKCVKVNHGTDVFETNSKSDYQKYWVSHGSGNGTCYPSKIDIINHGWELQGKDWEI